MPQEQKLRPGEKIDMPVFFYVDPEFATDPRMRKVNHLTLSYTFFKVQLGSSAIRNSECALLPEHRSALLLIKPVCHMPMLCLKNFLLVRFGSIH